MFIIDFIKMHNHTKLLPERNVFVIGVSLGQKFQFLTDKFKIDFKISSTKLSANLIINPK